MANCELMQRFSHLEAEVAMQTQQVMTQNEAHHCDIKGSMMKLSQEQKLLLESKFTQL
jgi:hypothetical protein